jgi:hypothetical protein
VMVESLQASATIALLLTVGETKLLQQAKDSCC